MSKTYVFVSLILLLPTGVIASCQGAGNSETTFVLADYQIHEPILIQANSDFVTLGFPGDGSVENPYVIEGLMIAGPFGENEAAIRVTDVTACFVIRDCILYDTVNMTSPKFGIVAPRVENAVIDGCVFQGVTDWGSELEYGINFVDSRNLTITNNEISGCEGYGIWDGNGWVSDSKLVGNEVSNCSDACIRVSGGSRNEISNNVVSGFASMGGMGIRARVSHGIVAGNRVSSDGGMGLYIDGNNNTVCDNAIEGCFYGLYLDGVNVVFNCTSSHCNQGFRVGGPSTLYNNTAENNEYGIWLEDSADRSNVTWNAFVNNTNSVHNDADPVLFDYNYWSDYDGVDADRDGIGDTPYEVFFENVVDAHPLMYYPWYNVTSPTVATSTTTITTSPSGLSFVFMLGVGTGSAILVVGTISLLYRRRSAE